MKITSGFYGGIQPEYPTTKHFSEPIKQE